MNLLANLAICLMLLTEMRSDGTASSRELAQRIEQIVSTLIEKAAIPGLSIAIGRQNQVWFSQGYGQADVENSIPATVEPNTGLHRLRNR